MTWVQTVFAPGFWQNALVTNALVAGAVVAIVSAALGYFVVLRGLSFAGHAVTDVGVTGAAGAVLLGASALWGLLVAGALAAVGIDLLGGEGGEGNGARERDVATGVVLALALGLGALFLYFSTRFVSEPFTLLFGSIFTVDPALTRVMVVIGLGCLAVLAALYRPLLFSSVSPETAAARGVPVRLVGALFLVTMAVGVAEAAQVVGALLSTALLIGPAAAAAYLTARPGRAIVAAAALGVLETWAGIVLSYDSYTWPGGKGWPASFFITTLALGVYLLARALRPVDRRVRQARPAAGGIGEEA